MISQALILMAGSGSRLRVNGHSLKPLVPISGRPLISHTLQTLARAGIRKTYAVVGFESRSLIAKVTPWLPPELNVHWIENRAWEKQNGISLLAAAGEISSAFLLIMSDHLFEQSIIDDLVEHDVKDRLNVAIDRKLDSIFDIADAMKVKTRGGKIIAIGKELRDYDAIDTGAFICPTSIFNYLEGAKRDNDCSLADGVRAMARAGKTQIIDIGKAWWQDVDTPEMLAWAEEKLQSRNGKVDLPRRIVRSSHRQAM